MLFDDIDSKALCDECVRTIDAYMMTHAAYEHMMAELRLIQAPIGGEPATEW